MNASVSTYLCVHRGQKWFHPSVEEDVGTEPNEAVRHRYHASVSFPFARQGAIDWVGILPFSHARCSGFGLHSMGEFDQTRDLCLDLHGQIPIPFHFGSYSISCARIRGGNKFLPPPFLSLSFDVLGI